MPARCRRSHSPPHRPGLDTTHSRNISPALPVISCCTVPASDLTPLAKEPATLPVKTSSANPRRPKGVTLLELTVVILVILSLISILFIGTRSWKRGSDRSGCIMNIRNAQNAVRAYQNSHAVDEGVSLDMTTVIIGPGLYIENPNCPGGGSYNLLSHVPYMGELVMTCSLSGSDEHIPMAHTDW